MKKKHLIITIIILSSSISFAQDFSIGVHDGISLYGINGRFDFKNFKTTQIQPRIGHSFGFSLNFRTTSFLTLQMEMNYEDKGFDFHSGDIVGLAYSGNFNIKYITIPLITNFEIGKNVRFYGSAGIYVSFLVKAENYTSFLSTSSSYLTIYDMSYDPTDIFNKYEFGGLIGLGIKISLCEKVRLIIDSRNNFGLTKAAKNTDYDYNSNQWKEETPDNFQNVHNRSLTISLGIIYKLNKKK